MDDRTLALCELSGDLLFHKIPVEKLAYYVDASLEAGRSVGRELQGSDIAALYHQHQIQIIRRDKEGRSFGVMLRGQATLSEKECSVELYEESIRTLADGEQLSTDTAVQIHLAHEFFHFWEYRVCGAVSDRLDSVETLRFLRLSRKAQINRCSEVAAHAFAKELLGLPYLPNYYDYRYLIRTGKMTQEALEKKFQTMATMLGGSAGSL